MAGCNYCCFARKDTLWYWLYFATSGTFSANCLSCRIKALEVIFWWRNYMIRFQSELAESCEKSAKNRVLRAHSYPKKAPSVSDRYLPLSSVKRGRVSTLWNCFFAVWARLPINSFIRSCPKMIPRLHRSCILQGSAMRSKSV